MTAAQVEALPRVGGPRTTVTGPVIDACAFHEWPSLGVLADYMPGDWGAVLTDGAIRLASPRLYESALPTKVGVAGEGTSFETFQAARFQDSKVQRVVLSYDGGLFATMHPNHYIADVVARAANDWTIDQWLSRESRLFGLVLVATAMPEKAAAEIRRVGSHAQMVGVVLGGNALGHPFGHPVYRPILEAADEMGLPIVLHPAPEAAADAPVDAIAGGAPSTYAEWRALAWHSHMTHSSSLIVQGTFDVFPNLKVVLAGGGVLWVPGQLWRLDAWHRMCRREAPWLKMAPSEYFADHFRLLTYEMERARNDETLREALSTIGEVEKLLLYGSCYPNCDWETVDDSVGRLPVDWQRACAHDNALNTFRWDPI